MMRRGLTTVVRDLVDRLPVRFRSAWARLVFVVLYWENFALTSLSMPATSFCSESIKSAMGLSWRYLILFH